MTRRSEYKSSTFDAHALGRTLIVVTILVHMHATAPNILAAPDGSPSDWVPAWAKQAVWYQIFPERFRNGDPGNDPTIEDIKGAWPHDQTSPWQVHPWTSDWYARQPYERVNGKSIWFQIQRRRYGGDIQGIIDKLDYLCDLGINAVYLNPVFQAPSLHKYDGATYHHIEPTFGPDPEEDKRLIAAETPDDPSTWVWTAADRLALRMVEEMHARGMRVIFDGVFNHVGMNHWAFRDVQQNQRRSKYKDWFAVKSWDDPGTGTKFDYEGWFGVRELPEWREDEYGIVDGPRQYIFASTRRWMDPNGDGDPSDGIDGWRLDVAFCVKHAFWKAWRRHVKSINPDAYLTAEVVEPPEVLRPYLAGDEFDAVMNYNFAFSCADYFIDETTRIPPSEFDRQLRELRETFDPCVAYVQQNLFDSHDSNRIGSHIVNRDRFEYRRWGEAFDKSKPEKNPGYDTRKPTADEIQTQKLFVVFQMTYLGAPMIYYGDEVGMWGANDPCCRKPMVWADLDYADEAYGPDGSKRARPDRVEVNAELLNHYRKLIRIRREHAALALGDFQPVLIDDERDLYAFRRTYRGQTIITAFNNGRAPQMVRIPVHDTAEYTDLLNGNGHYAADGDGVELTLERRWAAILLNRANDGDDR